MATENIPSSEIPVKEPRLKKKTRETILAYSFLLPSFIAISLFVFVPLTFAFIMSIFKNPSVRELREAVDYYLNPANLWWRNLSDFFVASAGDDIGILRDEGIFLMAYLLVLFGLLLFSYKIYTKFLQKTSKVVIGGLTAITSVIVTPVLLYITMFGLSFLPKVIRLPIEGYRIAFTSFEIEFFRILFNTVFWTATCVFFHVFLGLFLAVIMNRGISGQGFFRSIFILPWAIPSFVSALVWRAFVFNRNQGILGQLTANEGGNNNFILTFMNLVNLALMGAIIVAFFLYLNHVIVNRMRKETVSKYLVIYGAVLFSVVIGIVSITVLDLVGNTLVSFIPGLGSKIIDIPSINSTFWFTDDVYLFGIKFKMITFSAIITNIWLGVPFMMVSFLAALQSIPQDLYEAADIDGAGTWEKFKSITFPLLKPTVMTVSLLGVIWTFNLFNVFYILSQNQTGLGSRINYDIFVTFIYDQFNLFQYNAAAVLSFSVFLMLISFSLVYRRLLKAEAIFEGE
jgi:ABC-type sugar transport system permease subunit